MPFRPFLYLAVAGCHAAQQNIQWTFRAWLGGERVEPGLEGKGRGSIPDLHQRDQVTSALGGLLWRRRHEVIVLVILALCCPWHKSCRAARTEDNAMV
ncbi:MAG TPA: hypothetical protein VLQ80_30155 [Candidatus Saccharimonadia bacterium]|nr:hypothetical protein [Candidatus Saccharimonadia bacterium]